MVHICMEGEPRRRSTKKTIEGIVDYTISCECGQTHSVSAGAAGTRLSCSCGQQVEVPSLHVLRSRAGEATLGPELLITAAMQGGQLPASRTCIGCSAATSRIAPMWVVCEREEVKESKSIFEVILLLLSPIAGLAAI